MTTAIRFVVLTSALTNRDLPAVRLNSTRFLPRARREYLPVMISLAATLRDCGVTFLITGVLTAAAPAVADTTSAPSAARMAAPRSFWRVRDRFSIAPDIDRRPPPLEPGGLG